MRFDVPNTSTLQAFRRAAVRSCVSLTLAALVQLSGAAACFAEEKKADAEKPVNYQEHLLPILRESCFPCHNNDKTEGGLNVSNYASLMRGGGSGEVIAPGDPDGSYLYLLVTHQSEPKMPLNGAKLADAKLSVFRKFIEAGARETATSKPIVRDKPKASVSLAGAVSHKPDGPPPMPPKLSLEPVVAAPRAGAVTALAASPWAPLVAVAGQEQVLLYHSETLELLGVLPFPEGMPQVLKFSRNAKLLLAGGGIGAELGRVVVWNVETGERMFEVGDEADSVLAADISPDHSLIALGGPSKVVRIYSTADGKLLHEIKKHTEWVTAIEFNPDNVLLATGDRNGGVFVWEAATAQEYAAPRGHSAEISALSWRLDGNVLASASEDNSVRLWEMENGNQIKTWNAHGGVRSVEFDHEGRLVTCGRDAKAQRWNSDGKADGKPMQLSDVAMGAVTTFDGKRVLAGDWRGEVRVWSTDDWKQVGSLNANPPKLEQRLQSAAEQFAAAEAKHKAAEEAMAQSEAAATEMAAKAEQSQQAMQNATAERDAMQSAVAKLQSTIEQTAAEIDADQNQLAERKSAVDSLAEASAKAGEAAKKLPSSKPLTEAVAKLSDAHKQLEAEIAALQAKVKDRSAALAAKREELPQAQAKLAAATEQAAAAEKQLQAAKQAQQAADEKLAAARQALGQTSAALSAAESAKQRWTQEIEFAKKVAG